MTIGSIMRFIPKEGAKGKPITKGDGYLVIQYAGAQAFFDGSWLQRPQQVVITSQVDLKKGGAKAQVQGIEYAKAIKPDVAESIPLFKEIFSLVPATMDSIALKLDVVIDLTNTVAQMASLVNKGLFSPLLTLAAPAADQAVQKVGQIAGELIDAFIGGPQQQKKLVQFYGDFPVATDGVKPGYYALVGSEDPRYPLPDEEGREFTFNGTKLLIDGQEAEHYSWVVLEVRTARTRGRREGSAWAPRLAEIQAEVDHMTHNKLATNEEKRQAYATCSKAMKEVEVLVLNDPYYTESDARRLLAHAWATVNSISLEDVPARVRDEAAPAGQPHLMSVVPSSDAAMRLGAASVGTHVAGEGAAADAGIRTLPAGFASWTELEKLALEYEEHLAESNAVIKPAGR